MLTNIEIHQVKDIIEFLHNINLKENILSKEYWAEMKLKAMA